MKFLLSFAYIFIVGACSGWIIELFYRRFFSKNNPERKWINPGFCVGPYLPIYGFGVSTMYFMCNACNKYLSDKGIWGHVALFGVVCIFMTMLELVAGLTCLKFMNIRLWDYSREWGNFKGVICPRFSLYWTLIGVAYYYIAHPYIVKLITWMVFYIPLLFCCGMFYGIFFSDIVYSAELVKKIKVFAKEHSVVVNYEMLKAKVISSSTNLKSRVHFMRFFKVDGFKEMLDAFISDDGDDSNNGLFDRIKAVNTVRRELKEKEKVDDI